ncbi:MAG: hypothetical protein OEX22_10615 [Cyclobacteriaceae bacterium]|nr:hypothetical protein [Cyclobacteriaceae bacterium]
MKNIIATLMTMLVFSHFSQAQESSSKDTVIVNFGEKSKIVFYVNDKKDLASLEQYDLNAIAKDLKIKLEQPDSLDQHQSIKKEETDRFLRDSTTISSSISEEKDSIDNRKLTKKYSTQHFMNFDIGMNNYLENGKFPNDNNELYSARPWGSWFFNIGTNYKSQILGKLFIEYGASVSWHNFKFENDKIRMQKTATGTVFTEDITGLDYVSSKMTTTHLNVSLVPVLDFGKSNRLSSSIWNKWDGDHNRYHKGFRIGIGGYAGYKIGSHAKYIIEENGDKKKNKDKDSFYFNNWRYGGRLQLGLRGTDIFINYDISELFSTGNGPSLNAFSFGITL